MMPGPRIFVPLLLALLFTGGAIYVLGLVTMPPAQLEFVGDPPGIDFRPVEPPSCLAKDQLEARVIEVIAESRVCEADADCVVKHYGCPFDCATSVNVQLAGAVDSVVKQYLEYIEVGSCSKCQYLCRIFAPPIPVCRSGACDYELVGPRTEPAIPENADPRYYLDQTAESDPG